MLTEKTKDMNKLIENSPVMFWNLIIGSRTQAGTAYELATRYLYDKSSGYNRQKVIFYLHRAMDLGSLKATELLGYIYKFGDFEFTRDFDLALHYFKFAEMCGSKDAFYEILDIYFHGNNGEPYNAEEGVEFLDYFANNSVFANLLLSCIYRYGIYGIKQDIRLAVSHHSKAIKIGGADVEEMYEELKSSLFRRSETYKRISAFKTRMLRQHCK